MKRLYEVGMVVGERTIIKDLGRNKNGLRFFEMRCSCGGTQSVSSNNLKKSPRCAPCGRKERFGNGPKKRTAKVGNLTIFYDTTPYEGPTTMEELRALNASMGVVNRSSA